MGYFAKRFAYDLAKAHAKDKQAKKRAKQQAKIDREKAKEKARKQAEKEQEKAEKERIKTEERTEKERQAKERALLKLESLEIKFETNMQQAQEIFEYLQSKEEFMLKYCNDFQWVVEQVREKGAEKTSKPLQALVKKCDTLAKKLDTINNTLIQLMTIKDKYSTNVPMETEEWQEIYRQLMTFSNTIKTNLLKIIDCIEQIEQKILLEE